MRPVRTPDSNITLTLPGGTQENDLPAQRAMLIDSSRGQSKEDAQLGFVTVWQPDDAEARRLEAGACVELTVWGVPDGQGGKTMPPVAMAVTQAVVPERELIDRGHVDRALGHLYGELHAVIASHIDPDKYDTDAVASELLPDPGEMADLWAASVEATKPQPASYADPDDPAERAKLDPPEAG